MLRRWASRASASVTPLWHHAGDHPLLILAALRTGAAINGGSGRFLPGGGLIDRFGVVGHALEDLRRA